MLRHIRHRLQQGGHLDYVKNVLLQPFYKGDEELDEREVYDFEDNIEWSEFDEIIQYFSNQLLYALPVYYHIVDLAFRSVL